MPAAAGDAAGSVLGEMGRERGAEVFTRHVLCAVLEDRSVSDLGQPSFLWQGQCCGTVFPRSHSPAILVVGRGGCCCCRCCATNCTAYRLPVSLDCE